MQGKEQAEERKRGKSEKLSSCCTSVGIGAVHSTFKVEFVTFEY